MTIPLNIMTREVLEEMESYYSDDRRHTLLELIEDLEQDLMEMKVRLKFLKDVQAKRQGNEQF